MMESCDILYNKIRLRAMEPEDVDFLYAVENDVEIWDQGETNVPYSRSVLLDYITSSRADIYADRQVRLIVEREDGVPVGVIDLVNYNPRHARAELGIVIKKEYRQQGFASAALRKIIAYAKNVVNLHQIYAIVKTNNESCVRLLQNFGFQGNMVLKEWLGGGDGYENALLFQYFL